MELAARRQRPDAVSRAAGDGLDRQRRIDAADSRENRPVANPKVAECPSSGSRASTTLACRIVAHAGGAVEVAGVVLLIPDLTCARPPRAPAP